MKNQPFCTFIGGVATGIVIGSITAALVAPKNGRDTRDSIVVKGQEWQQQAQNTKEDVAARGGALAASMKDRKERVSSTVQDQAKAVSDRAKQAMETTNQEWKALKEESLLAASNAREGVQEEKERLKQDIDQEIQEAKHAASSRPSASSPTDES